MKLNPYQRIIIDGKQIQRGEFGDTTKKFRQLVQGVDLTGKTVLDVGCNLGMMCNLSKQCGAIPRGIDISPLYVSQARSLFPDIPFAPGQSTNISGKYDIIIASAMLHYVTDLDKAFRGFARCANQVLCDVWLNDSPDNVFTLSHRGLYIPSRSAFLGIAGKHFSKIEEKGPAETPDGSTRFIFQLSKPNVAKPKAVIIYGDGDTGKTTIAHTYFGYDIIHTDNIFHTYKIQNISTDWSIKNFHQLVRGNLLAQYYKFSLDLICQWLGGLRGKDIVIEGYDLGDADYRGRVIEKLSDWDVEVIKKERDF